MEKPMAPDERDRSFDKALARHLRSAAPAGEAARLPEIPALQSGACPDSEALAAYHERSLLPEQLNSLKEHIVGCANCQTVLAHLETTDEISLQTFEEVGVVAKASEPVVGARNLETFPAAAAPSQSQRAAVAPRQKSRRILLLGGARWQWLAPAGAIAADEFASARARSASSAMKSSEKPDYPAQVSPSKPLADKESSLRKDAERRASNDLLRAQEQLDRDAEAVGGAKQENAEVQLQAQAANVPSQNQSNANSPKPPGPPALGQAESKQKLMKSAPPAPAPPPR